MSDTGRILRMVWEASATVYLACSVVPDLFIYYEGITFFATEFTESTEKTKSNSFWPRIHTDLHGLRNVEKLEHELLELFEWHE